MTMMSLLHLYVAITVLSRYFTFTPGQRFSLRGQSYPNHGLVLIDEIGETDSTDENSLSCVSDLTDCCSSANAANERGDFDFPDGSVVPTLGDIRNGYYRNRGVDRIFLNRRPEGTAQGLFQCRIRTVASPDAYEEFYIGVYDENSGVPTVSDASTSGLSITCASSGGPATTVTWRRNCAVLPNSAMYQQTQTVDVTQTATYRNMLVIDSAVTDTDGVYTCSVTNTRGYDSGAIGMGASYDPTLPVIVTVTPSSASPVAGGSFTLTCDHGSTASNPAYQWFDDAGNDVGTQATLTLNPLRESHSGEYSCLITDQSDGLVGCGVHRVSVQAPSVTISVGGLTNVSAGTSQTITCSVSGFDISAATVTSEMYTWLRGSTVVQAASTSSQYTIPSRSLMVTNAGDVYTCEVAITTSYWDVSGSFGNSGSGTLTIIIPNPTIEITEIPLETEYVGLNYTLRCEAVIPGSQLEDIEAVIEWMKDGIRLSSSSNGRITLGNTRIDSVGREFRRSIMFSPLSAGDMGSYSCSATIRPTVANSRVTNGIGIGSSNLTVAVPTLEVSIDRAGVPLRILDMSPFNGFPLTCITTSRVTGTPVSTRKQITWMRSIDGGPSEPLTNGANVDSVVTVMEGDLAQAASMSMLMVNTTMSGSHSYSCRAELVVAPAPEVINEQNETTISVVGPSSPVEPMNLMADDITQNSATIRWTVASLSYDLETYVVQYGLAMDSLTTTSSMVMGDVTPLNYMDDFQGSVTLTGLTRLTPYYYRVMATNNGGAFTTLSEVNTFNTSAQAPEPPTMLQCSQVPNDPLSYSCNWMAPAVTNGMLSGYELECLPGLEGIPPPPVATPSATSATVSGLRNGVNYTCTVRARNAGGLSLASAPTSFYIIQIVPGPPICPQRWTTKGLSSLSIDWQPPINPNGLITGYFLELVSFDNQTVLQSGSESGSLSHRFTGFNIAAGVPYHVRVYAENINGRGSYCITTDFGDQLTPPNNILNDFSSSFDLSDILLTWTVLPLDQAKGFISLSITFGPLTFTNELEARQKRQTSSECGQSPCKILYEEGSVRITGLTSNLDYFIVVVPQNEEGEIGTPTALGIPAISELQLSTRNNSTAAIAGGSAVIAVLVLLLLVAVAVIVVILVRQRKQKYPLDYELPVGTPSTSDRKSDILTTRCEAYEVMKLQEVHQGHAHTDTGAPEQEYEEVGDAERRHGQQVAAGTSQPQQETTTQQMYEEVATH